MISRPFRCRLSVLVAGAALGVSAAVASLPSPRTNWRTVQSPNFLFLGDVPARTLTEAAERLELFRAALARLTPAAADRPPLPTTVLLFSNNRSFRPYALSGKPGDDIAAVFHPTAWGSYMVLDAGGGESALDLVYSGYVHQVIAHGYPETPLWLNSGLSEYYRTFRVTSSGIEIGRPAPHHVQVLRDHGRIPLARLLVIDYSSPEYRDSDFSDAYFAQCWALAHYLLIGEPALTPRVPDLIARIGRGEPVEAALQAALGFGVAELENRIVSYARRSIFQYATWPRGDLAAPALPDPADLPRAAALELLAEYLAHAGDAAAAREHLDEALRLGGETGDALALSAFLAEGDHKWDEAGQLYARALDLPARRVCSPAHAARFAIDRLGDTAGDAAAEQARLELARRAVEKALELDPDYGEAWAIKGFVALRAGEPTTALVALAEAQRRLPGRQDIVYNRFRAAVAAGQTAVARGIATGVLARLDPGAARQAVAELAEREDYELANQASAESEKALAEGRYGEAAAPLRAALERVRGPVARGRLEERLGAVEKYAASRRRVAEYNRAVALTDARKYREAREVVAAVVADCADEPVCPSARELLDWLDRHQGTKR